MINKNYITWGALFIVLSIVLGALGAHALKKVLTNEQLSSFETGVKYQMYAGIGIILLQLIQFHFQTDNKLSSLFLVIGCLLFSFSIYLLNLSTLLHLPAIAKKILGPITPIGGLLQITAWIIFIFKWIKN